VLELNITSLQSQYTELQSSYQSLTITFESLEAQKSGLEDCSQTLSLIADSFTIDDHGGY
jgi:prefoldin subunit 5